MSATIEQLKKWIDIDRQGIRWRQRRMDGYIDQILARDPLLKDQYRDHWIAECRNCGEAICSEHDWCCPKCKDTNPFDRDLEA